MEGNGIASLNCLRKGKGQTRIPLQWKFYKQQWNQELFYKWKLRKFVTNRSALQDILKDIFLFKRKWYQIETQTNR